MMFDFFLKQFSFCITCGVRTREERDIEVGGGERGRESNRVGEETPNCFEQCLHV